jgi:2-keto-4-pentenoate hydratase/2-oxohepta-3-ene-1,7-dioic acid hydratase in catechol pathway
MKLVRIAGSGTGLVAGSGAQPFVVEVAAAAALGRGALADQLRSLFPAGTQSWLPMIRQWPAARGTLLSLLEAAEDDLARGRERLGLRPLGEVPLDPPLPDPAAQIFAMGGNFPQHADKMTAVTTTPQQGAPPWGFTALPATVVGPGAMVTPPEGTRKLDYEAEVAIVLGDWELSRGSDQISVWGYTAWNDFSIRDHALGLAQIDHGPLTWSLTKNFRTGHSCGPWLAVDEPTDVADLRIRCLVNGEFRQDGSTAEMQHSFVRIAAYISQFAPLRGGDMILSGTPGGTAIEGGLDGPFLRDGDEVEVLVDGIASLRNQVKMSGTAGEGLR